MQSVWFEVGTNLSRTWLVLPVAGKIVEGCQGLCALQLPGIGLFRASPFRLIWRTIYVIIITVSPSAVFSISHLLTCAISTLQNPEHQVLPLPQSLTIH